MRRLLIVCMFTSALLMQAVPVRAASSGEGELAAQVYQGVFHDLTLLDLDDSKQAGAFSKSDLQVDALSKSEVKLVGAYIDDAGKQAGLGLTFLSIPVVMTASGKMPQNGYELMLMLAEPCSDGAARLDSSDISKLSLDTLGRCVNPATGSLFGSFTDPSWRPLECYIERVEGNDGIKMIPKWGNGTSGEMAMVPHRIFRITVFGETPGRVILKDELFWEE